jgi:hypothetical protein
MMEAQRSSETPNVKKATRRNIPKDAILNSYRREKPEILQRYILVPPEERLGTNFPTPPPFT